MKTLPIEEHIPRNKGKPLRIATALALCACLAGGALHLNAASGTITDSGISQKIEKDMKDYNGISSHLIDVSVEDGIVTLSGYVDNLLAREQSVLLSRSVKGVRSVINQIQVRPVPKSDSQIKRDVIKAMASDPATESWEIDVTVNDGLVTLDGTVESWQEKQLAENIAKGVAGVQEVENGVLYIPAYERPDTEIAADIQQRMKNDIRLNSSGIKVTVEDAEVALSGTVASSAAKALAENLAWVTSVKDVNSDALTVSYEKAMAEKVKLRGQPALKDSEIEQAIRDSFAMDNRIQDFDINVEVENGIVTLTGKVDNYVARMAAEKNARNTVGTREVISMIKVRPLELITDKDLEERVIDALKRSPFLDHEDIDVEVENSLVGISGEVDNTFMITEATRVVSHVDGLVDLHNNLTANGRSLPEYALNYSWYDYVPDGYWPFQDIPTTLDTKIKKDVEQQLFWSPYLDSDQIKVRVENGSVILEGFVEDYAERQMATQNAWEGGARGVRNHLEVR